MCTGRDLHPGWYAYLLGLYLGDGCLTRMPRDVYKLRITLDAKYPLIIVECKDAVRAVRADADAKIGQVRKVGCFEICHHWKHWICLFPQHGPGRKHERKIELEPWQELVLITHPERLLRGLIHSDGCRAVNRVVNGGEYPRYQFSNRSADIRNIFCRACEAFDIPWRQSNAWTISISRRPAVEALDLVIGPKR